jgi:regulator of protease activity HflC (stomatin/prohibitin superfamily)
VDQNAVEALKKMSQYLMSLNTLQITSDASIDMVTSEGQRIQFDGTSEYKVKRPGFVIRFVSDAKSRDFYYDGKQFTRQRPIARSSIRSMIVTAYASRSRTCFAGMISETIERRVSSRPWFLVPPLSMA